MTKVNCLNPISELGTGLFNNNYEMTDNFADADVALVRSAAMHDLDLPESLLAIARAGAGVNNIPLDKCADKGVVVFNTPGANANGVKELVLCRHAYLHQEILLAVTSGLLIIRTMKISAKIWKRLKKNYAGNEIKGKKAWRNRSWSYRND